MPKTVGYVNTPVVSDIAKFPGFYRIYVTIKPEGVFGISPVDDLIRARIDTAKTRLSISDETVAHLAEQLGYRNATHFCRPFKSLPGLTPMEYRNYQQR